VTGTLSRVATFQSAGLYLLAPAARAAGRPAPALRVDVEDAEPEATLPSLALGALTSCSATSTRSSRARRIRAST
jgi:hypothetical protein